VNELDAVYLKPNVQVEPLVAHWYAWPLLVAPATAAMITKNLHLRLLQSYLKAPQIHAAAAKNPALRGGMFLDYSGDIRKIEEVVRFLTERLAGQLKLADAIKELDTLLSAEARGESLGLLYERVPEPLKGYVELVYDINNRASIRFVESLLFESEHYDTSLQALRLSLLDGDKRPFVLSTPRIKQDDNLIVDVPFDSPRVDELFGLRTRPQPFAQARALLGWDGLNDQDRALCASLFTTATPATDPSANRCTHDGVRVRYYNHATLLIETPNVSILLDPVVSYDIDGDVERFSYKDLPETIDYVLLTHNHQDHVMFETLLQIRQRVKTFVVPRSGGGTLPDPSLRLILEATGFENVIELDELQSLKVPDGEIRGLPFFGEHGDLNIRSKLGYQLRLNGCSILALADSNNLEHRLYERLQRSIGDVDVIFIGMECDGAPMSWLYGPLLTTPLGRKMDQSRRLDGSNFERARRIVDQLKPKAVYVYAMGAEPWLGYITSIHYTETSTPIVESNNLVEYCRSQSIASERLYGKKEMHFERRR
jgi:L-ascorbate metabolism protein UlaG (beta-lactamase superfamily)